MGERAAISSERDATEKSEARQHIFSLTLHYLVLPRHKDMPVPLGYWHLGAKTLCLKK